MLLKVLLVKARGYESVKGTDAPLGLLYLASYLIKRSHKVEVEDLMLIEPELGKVALQNHIHRMGPDMVGIACNSHERFFAFEVAKWVKELRSNIKVLIGGVHATFAAESTLKSVPYIDIAVRHEGEIPLKELCSGDDPASVAGITYRDEKGNVVSNPPREFISNLDELPFPARDLIPMEKYELRLPILDNPRVISIITSRGCPFKCNFCSATLMAGNRIRMRSPENVVDEMEMLMSKYSFLEGLFIYDDHFTVNQKRAIAIAKEIKKRKLDMRLGCYGRVDSISRELVKALKSAGFEMISFGIESGSTKVLRAMNKKTNPRMIRDAIKMAKSEGIVTRASLFFEYPGEGFLDILKTFGMMYRCFAPYEIVMGYHPIIYPETQLFHKLKEEGVLPKNFNWEDKFDIPNYKDVPIYIPPNDNLRQLLINALFKSYKVSYWFRHPIYSMGRFKAKIQKS